MKPSNSDPVSNHDLPDLYDLNSYVFDLPLDRIAQYPPEKRGASRLLVLDRPSGELSDCCFDEIVSFFQPGDTIVLNRTRVIPARLFGIKETGARVELFFLEEDPNDPSLWQALVRPAKRLKPGHRILFPGYNDVSAYIEEELPEPGMRLIRFEGPEGLGAFMERAGHIPLPPYINRKDEELDRERYQTVFAETGGSVAAPTAGLHFTTEILNALAMGGVNIQYILLHVGLGTFRPVSVQDIRQHQMHAEYYQLNHETAQALNQCRADGGRIFAVGSTVMRTLETVSDQQGRFEAAYGKTDCFLYPGYAFKAVDGFLTNFHLPGSSLIMLVAAFAGYANTMNAYRYAVDNAYRFFSYGDAMLIKP